MGAGSRLKQSFADKGIRSGSGCSCEDVAKKMDREGPAWCREHAAELLEEIRANARRRKWPIVLSVVRAMLKHAIEDEERHLAGLAADMARTFEHRVSAVLEDVANGPRPRAGDWSFHADVYAAHKRLFAQKLAALTKSPLPGDGRGIVTLGGGLKYFPATFVLCHTLRAIGCTLPIEVWYLSRHEFDHRMEAALEPFGVRCVDALPSLPTRPRAFGGWEAKAWAISYSAFREVLFLDCDNLPLRDPAYLFEHERYREAGVVAWPDFKNEFGFDCTRQAFEVLGLPVPARSVEVPNHDKPTDYTPWETGQLLVDKSRATDFLEVARILSDHSDWWYPQGGTRAQWPVYGDKSTFMLAALATSQRVALAQDCARFGDRNGGGFTQYDLDGQELFQHRCQPTVKIRLGGVNSPAGLLQPERFHQAVAAAKAAWKSAIWDWDAQGPADVRVATTVPGPYFCTGLSAEIGRIELQTGGEIAGARGLHWRICHVGTRALLIVANGQRAVAICDRYDNGWIDRDANVAIQHTAPAWWEGMDSLFTAHVWADVFRKNEYKLPASIDGALVVDIGAHEGVFSHLAFERGARWVASVEPNAENFARLTRNLESRLGSIRLHNAAWRSDEPPRWVSLDQPPQSDHHSGGDAVVEPARSPVRTIGLDTLIDELLVLTGRSKIDLLKIDCEGAEWPVLLSSQRLAAVDAICGELHAAWLFQYPDWWRTPRTKHEAIESLRVKLSDAGFAHKISIAHDAGTRGYLWAWRTTKAFV